MSDLSNYAENALVNALLRNTAFTPPATVYLALATAVTDPETGAAGLTEVAASGYARQPVTFDAPTNGATANSDEVSFGPLAGTGTVTHAALFDAASGGNALTAAKALDSSKSWTDGDSIVFAAGDIDFSLA